MKNFNFKSKVGFTLIELLVVIGILAVLAAIAIPAVAGLIDRANVSADDTNANEMTNSVERFVSEYELFRQDIASGKFDKNKMDSAQGRVYAVTGVEDRAGIESLEGTGTADGILLNIDTKYPVNEKTLKRVVNNYMKTSASTFTPKQSDCSYYYSPALGTVVCAETGSTIDDLSAIVLSYDSASVVRNSTMLATASNGVQVEWMNLTLNANIAENEWTNDIYASETKGVYKNTSQQNQPDELVVNEYGFYYNVPYVREACDLMPFDMIIILTPDGYIDFYFGGSGSKLDSREYNCNEYVIWEGEEYTSDGWTIESPTHLVNEIFGSNKFILDVDYFENAKNSYGFYFNTPYFDKSGETQIIFKENNSAILCSNGEINLHEPIAATYSQNTIKIPLAENEFEQTELKTTNGKDFYIADTNELILTTNPPIE